MSTETIDEWARAEGPLLPDAAWLYVDQGGAVVPPSLHDAWCRGDQKLPLGDHCAALRAYARSIWNDELNEYERDVLAGYHSGTWGGMIGAVLESLKGYGLMKGHDTVTPKGRVVLRAGGVLR